MNDCKLTRHDAPLSRFRSMKKMRILIVEDVQLEAEMLERALYAFKILHEKPEVIVTNSFYAACEIVVNHTPPLDIVILDGTLSDVDMTETIRNVTEIEDHVPTFILTGYAKEDVEKMLADAQAAHIEVVEKGPGVFNGMLTAIISRVIVKWHERRNRKLRECLQVLDNFHRETA